VTIELASNGFVLRLGVTGRAQGLVDHFAFAALRGRCQRDEQQQSKGQTFLFRHESSQRDSARGGQPPLSDQAVGTRNLRSGLLS
jgi:hypothetical protein